MLKNELKYISLVFELFNQKTPLDKAIVGFKLITRTPIDDSYNLFWMLNESLKAEQSQLPSAIETKIVQSINGAGVKCNIQDMCTFVPDELLILAFQDAVGGHLSQNRKGILERPYMHHILMVWYLTALCGGNIDQQIAALLHDYPEDVPDRGLTLATTRRVFAYKYKLTATSYIFQLKNKEGLSGKTPEKAKEKHDWQLGHLEKMKKVIQVIKLCDRLSNMYDMRRDGPASNNPESIRKELGKWKEFRSVCKKMPILVDEFSEYVHKLLCKKYCIEKV